MCGQGCRCPGAERCGAGAGFALGVVDVPPPLAAAAIPAPPAAVTAADASTIAVLRMEMGSSPFVRWTDGSTPPTPKSELRIAWECRAGGTGAVDERRQRPPAGPSAQRSGR